jgi:hypothetical protein
VRDNLRGVAAELWQIISEELGENIKKSNFVTTLKRLNLSIKSSNFFKDVLQIHNINYCSNNNHNPDRSQSQTSEEYQQKSEINILTDIPLLGDFHGRKKKLLS